MMFVFSPSVWVHGPGGGGGGGLGSGPMLRRPFKNTESIGRVSMCLKVLLSIWTVIWQELGWLCNFSNLGPGIIWGEDFLITANHWCYGEFFSYCKAGLSFFFLILHSPLVHRCLYLSLTWTILCKCSKCQCMHEWYWLMYGFPCARLYMQSSLELVMTTEWQWDMGMPLTLPWVLFRLRHTRICVVETKYELHRVTFK